MRILFFTAKRLQWIISSARQPYEADGNRVTDDLIDSTMQVLLPEVGRYNVDMQINTLEQQTISFTRNNKHGSCCSNTRSPVGAF